MATRYTEQEARDAIAASFSYAEALRRMGMRPAGHNHRTLKKYATIWGIATQHFDPNVGRRRLSGNQARPLASILVEHSSYSRNHLKSRLFKEGVKERRCELCGQDEVWRGRRMALILDHVNGVADDHRLENLQIVCPNCAATLDTHCGKQNRIRIEPRWCRHCAREFTPSSDHRAQRFCSQRCYFEHSRGAARPERRKVDRPPYNHLVREVGAIGFLATGRRYGVSDNAIRKWLRQYEAELEAPPRLRSARE